MVEPTGSLHLLQVCGLVALLLLGNLSFTVARSEYRKLQAVNTAAVGQIEDLYLINADTDLPIQVLRNGSLIITSNVATSNFSIEARTTNGTVGSVRFAYNNITNYRTENDAPFAFCGNAGTDFAACSVLGQGQHTIRATPFYNRTTRKPPGTPYQVTFTIVDATSAPTKAPTKVPTTSSPTKTPTTGAPTNFLSTKAPTKAPTRQPTSRPTFAPVSCTLPQFLEPSWQVLSPDYPMETEEPQGLLLGNDFVQFSGYTARFKNITNQTYARDVTVPNSPWRRMEDVPVALGITHAPALAIGMKVYLCGGYIGFVGGVHMPDCFVYDHAKAPGTGQWSRLPNLPNGGSGGGGMIYDRLRNALYYSGGAQRYKSGSIKATDVNNTYRYSFDAPGAGWVATSPLPYLANHLSYVTHTDVYGRERHFFLGGQEAEFECCRNVATTYEFVAATETWVRRAPMLLARGHASASTRPIGCGFIIAGGSINAVNGSTVRVRTSDVSYYDLPTDTWMSLGSLPFKGATQLVDIHPNGYMYASNDQLNRRRIG